MPTGLPVMKPGSFAPWIASNSSSIQSMCCGLVMTSGAGTSLSGPTFFASWRTQPRQISSCSRMLRLCGSQMTPPLPPPSGMSTTAHFQVIHMASARTVSTVSCGWKRMPPLQGPRASLCCTRKPRNTFTLPSSMRTGMLKAYSRIGLRSRSRVAGVELEELGDLVELRLRGDERIVRTLGHVDHPLSVLARGRGARPAGGGKPVAGVRETSRYPGKKSPAARPVKRRRLRRADAGGPHGGWRRCRSGPAAYRGHGRRFRSSRAAGSANSSGAAATAGSRPASVTPTRRNGRPRRPRRRVSRSRAASRRSGVRAVAVGRVTARVTVVKSG